MPKLDNPITISGGSEHVAPSSKEGDIVLSKKKHVDNQRMRLATGECVPINDEDYRKWVNGSDGYVHNFGRDRHPTGPTTPFTLKECDIVVETRKQVVAGPKYVDPLHTDSHCRNDAAPYIPGLD